MAETGRVLVNIQALRALAALMVVLYHLKEMGAALGVPPGYLSFAALGVDLFFVISGFIMVFTTDAATTSGTRFLKNRIARVVPLYWVMTLFVFAIGLLAPELLQRTRAVPLDLIRSLFFIPYVRGDGHMWPVLFLGWSLNYEMFFYLVFAVSLGLGGRRWHLPIAVAVIVALVTAGLLFRPEPRTIASFYVSPKMLEFAAGMLIARIFPLLPGMRFGGMAALVAGFLWLFVTPLFVSSYYATYSALGASSLILLGALAGERGGLVARWPLIILLGDASYSLYLVHPLVTQAIITLWRRIAASDPSYAAPGIVAGLVISAVAGVVCYRLVEKPLSRVARRAIGARRPAVPARGL